MVEELKSEETSIEDVGIAYLGGELHDESSEYITRFLFDKVYIKDKKPDHIKFFINSLGGEINKVFHIIDLMNAIDIPIWTYGIGEVYSASLMIFMAGAKGHRYLFPNTSIMSHQWSGSDSGKEHEIMATRREHDLVTGRMLKHYESHCNLKRNMIKKKLLPPQDVYLTPEEAIKYGLGDHIIYKL